MMINVWRPLSLVERNPLAIVDGSTMSERDLFNCKLNNARSEIPNSYGMNVEFRRNVGTMFLKCVRMKR